jgi:hypothetical protein
MTITREPSDEERRSAEAAPEDPTVALLKAWLREDATEDPGALQQAEAELAAFKRDMNAPRREAGERLLYPDPNEPDRDAPHACTP